MSKYGGNTSNFPTHQLVDTLGYLVPGGLEVLMGRINANLVLLLVTVDRYVGVSFVEGLDILTLGVGIGLVGGWGSSGLAYCRG